MVVLYRKSVCLLVYSAIILKSRLNQAEFSLKMSKNRIVKCSCVKDMLAIASSCPVLLHKLIIDLEDEVNNYYDLALNFVKKRT